MLSELALSHPLLRVSRLEAAQASLPTTQYSPPTEAKELGSAHPCHRPRLGLRCEARFDGQIILRTCGGVNRRGLMMILSSPHGAQSVDEGASLPIQLGSPVWG